MFAELEERRRCPRDDVPSALVAAELPLPDGEGSRSLTIEELMGIFQQLIGAGNETTTKLFSEMMRMLAEQHDEWWKLKADPERAPRVVEEALRLASPTQGLYRKVTRDVEIEGTSVPAGDRVLVMFAAANRDPATFPDPQRFDPDRPNVRNHVAFGGGVHFCIGAPLSRLESVVALERLAHHWEDFRLADSNTFEYEPSFLLRGLKDLVVEFTRGS
jgi:cytochrome P450